MKAASVIADFVYDLLNLLSGEIWFDGFVIKFEIC